MKKFLCSRICWVGFGWWPKLQVTSSSGERKGAPRPLELGGSPNGLPTAVGNTMECTWHLEAPTQHRRVKKRSDDDRPLQESKAKSNYLSFLNAFALQCIELEANFYHSPASFISYFLLSVSGSESAQRPYRYLDLPVPPLFSTMMRHHFLICYQLQSAMPALLI